MKNVLIYCTFCATLFFANNLNAQNTVLETFKAVNIHYSEMEEYGFDLQMTYFDQEGSQIMKESGKIIHTSKVHYMHIAGNTTLVRGKEYISISHNQKRLIYSAYDEKFNQKQSKQLDIGATLDSLWAQQDQFRYEILNAPAGMQRILIKDEKNPHFDAFEVLVDLKKDELREFIYYYKLTEDQNTISQIKLEYLNETARPKTNLNELKVNYYVQSISNKVTLTELFSDYILIDQSKILKEYE